MAASDGVTAVTAGQTLSVAQLTGLMFKPTAGLFGQSSTFSYKVTDPSGLSTTGAATLGIGPAAVPTGYSPNGSSIMGGSGGSLVTSAGAWTFSTTMAGDQVDHVILLNGWPWPGIDDSNGSYWRHQRSTLRQHVCRRLVPMERFWLGWYT